VALDTSSLGYIGRDTGVRYCIVTVVVAVCDKPPDLRPWGGTAQSQEHAKQFQIPE